MATVSPGRFGRPAVFFVAVLLILGGSVLAFRSIAELVEASAMVDRTREVQYELEALLSALKDVEAGKRGFILSGDERLLRPYLDAIDAIPGSLRHLRQLTASKAVQQEFVDRLEPLVAERLDQAARVIEKRRADATSAVDLTTLLSGKELMDGIRAVIAEMNSFEVRLQQQRAGAAERQAGVAKAFIVIGTGLSLGLLGLVFVQMHREVSRRRRAETGLATLNAELEERVRGRTEEVQNSMRFLAAILGNMQDAVLVLERGRFVFANDASVGLFGAGKADRIIGRPASEFFHADSQGPIGERIAAATGTVERAPILEARVVRADGAAIEVEVAAAGFMSRGEPAVLMTLRDIRRRKAAEAEIRASEARYRTVVDLIVTAIWIHVDDRIVFANREAARLFGVAQPEQLIGRPILDFIHPDDRERERERIRLVIEGRQPAALAEMRFLGPGGRIAVAEVQGAPFDYQGRPAVLAAARDVTQRREVESQLRQAQKMEAIGQLTGGLAHDFNNMLMVVIGNIDLLDARLASDPAARKLAQTALSAALRGAEITRRLLAYSRQQPLASSVIDVGELVRGSAEMLRRTLGEKITVVVKPPAEPWQVESDEAQLESALVNLALNGRDAMPEGGELTIAVENRQVATAEAARISGMAPGDYVMVAVSDSGTGIEPEHLDRVLEPFFTTKEVGKGSGLGLSMVYGFVKQSGGHLKIESAPGRGTTVRLFLPRKTSVPAAERPGPAPATGLDRGNGELILVVDDNSQVRETVAAQLNDLGYRTVEAADAASALELIKTTPGIVLLFTDVVMPGGASGAELAVAGRQIRPELRVLFTSGFNNVGAIPKEQVFIKPYRKNDLARKLRDVLTESWRPAAIPRLLIVDDEAEVGRYVAAVASECGYGVSVTSTAKEFLAALSEFAPTHVALDLAIPDADGIELIKTLAKRTPQPRVLIMSGMATRLIRMASEIGAAHGLAIAGTIEKPIRAAELAQLLNKVAK